MASNNKEKRILSLKTDLILSLLFILCVGLYILYFYFQYDNDPKNDTSIISQISRLLADGFLVVVIIGYIYEKVLRRETEDKINFYTNQAIKRLDQRLPEILIQTLIYGKDSHKRFLSDTNTDEIFTLCLEKKLKDEKMAAELKESFFQEIFRYQERWYNLVHYISLKEIDDPILNNTNAVNSCFLFEDHISYKTNWTKNGFKFICSKTSGNLDKYMKDETYHSCWQFRAAFIEKLQEPYFFINRIQIDNLELNIERTILDDGSLLISCQHDELHNLIGKEVQVDYIVTSLVRKASNCSSIKIPNPTKDLRVTFDISRTNLKRLSVFPFFISQKTPSLTYPDNLSNSNNPRIIDLYLTDWIFPISGLTFVWQYEAV